VLERLRVLEHLRIRELGHHHRELGRHHQVELFTL
jgi:hypothetical protein